MKYVFGAFELDRYRRQLSFHNAQIHIEPKMVEVLLYLVQHRDRIVTKEELLDEVWAGSAVGESVLFKCVSTLRKAMGDERAQSAVIRTYYGRGYRFVASVFETDWAETQSRGPKPDIGFHVSAFNAPV